MGATDRRRCTLNLKMKFLQRPILALLLLLLGTAQAADSKCWEHIEEPEDWTAVSEKCGIGKDEDIDPCKYKCFLEGHQLLDDSGHPVAEKFLEMANHEAVAAHKDAIVAIVKECLDQEGGKVEPEAENCGGYQGLLDCFKPKFDNLC